MAGDSMHRRQFAGRTTAGIAAGALHTAEIVLTSSELGARAGPLPAK